ncbi:MAG: pyridoxal phosphate-dependent decarboxylase family protein [Chloroflexota bacterium]
MERNPDTAGPLGDLPPETFRRYGHEIVDWITEYLSHPDEFPVLSRSLPGDIERSLPAAPPDTGESMAEILTDFHNIIVPGVTHWNHPAFFAYFATTGSEPGILAEMLAAALNVNGMLWRTSPAATELETRVLDWLRQMVGLPQSFEGVIFDTASISSLVAIAAAREAAGLRIRELGMSGRGDVPSLRLYCSEHAHSSIEKDAITLGIGAAGVRKIAVDVALRMDPAQLEQAIQDDLAAGHRPFCVVGTVGTTSTTSIDPVPAIAAIAHRYDLWLHVDAAYAGVAAIVPEMRWVLDGCEHADSIVINPHKWLFTPVDLSTLFSPRLDSVRAAFSLVPDYLKTSEGESVRDYMNYGPQLGRRFRALKLWFVIRTYGQRGIVERLREHVRLAALFESWVADAPDWEILAPVHFSTVCFRWSPPGVSPGERNELNVAIEDALNGSGIAFISHTILHGEVTLRLAIGHLLTEERHLRQTWTFLQEASAEVWDARAQA